MESTSRISPQRKRPGATLLSSVREGGDDSIAPTGLSSDNYAGLIFWDAEIWMYPSLLLMHPNAAESVLDYRRKTLPGARANASLLGYAVTEIETMPDVGANAAAIAYPGRQVVAFVGSRKGDADRFMDMMN